MFTSRLTDEEDFNGFGIVNHWVTGLTKSFLKEDEIVAIVGYAPIYGNDFGVAQGWGIFSPEGRGSGGYILNGCKEFDDEMLAIFWRLHTMVDSRDENAMRFVLELGYSPESVMTQAGPHGQDMIMYRRLRS